MRKQPWSDKRERQYEHIRDGLEQRGRSEDTAEEVAEEIAEEIAECTVNKERAQAGEAKEASATSTQDKSASKRAGPALARGPQGRTRDELYADAKRLGIDGRSTMDKDELERAVHRVERRD
ncbi:MAG: plasmid stabilization protein [Corynebacterium variabile]|uniref:plasmid stabilization protein n=1 Tax=Corynebacterium variabile TaxID=1727 RepID=UPI003F913B0A